MSPPSSISILNKEEGETRLQPPLIEVSTNSKWLKEDIWLRDFLHTQAGLSAPAGALEDPAWWTVVSNACGGLGEEFLTREFAKMEAHLIENPLDRPKTPRGWKRFVRGWLCRSDQWERERKSSGGQEKKRLAR